MQGSFDADRNILFEIGQLEALRDPEKESLIMKEEQLEGHSVPMQEFGVCACLLAASSC